MRENLAASKRLLFLRVAKAESDPKFAEAHSTKLEQKAHPPRRQEHPAGRPCNARKDVARPLRRRATKRKRAHRFPRARGCDRAFVNRASFPSRDIRESPPAKTGHRRTNSARPNGERSNARSCRAQLLRCTVGQPRIETASQQGCDRNPGSQREGKLKKKKTHIHFL